MMPFYDLRGFFYIEWITFRMLRSVFTYYENGVCELGRVHCRITLANVGWLRIWVGGVGSHTCVMFLDEDIGEGSVFQKDCNLYVI